MQTHDFYFAGELFDAKHLLGNAWLASEILKNSDGRFIPVMPQEFESQAQHPHEIRDQDILALIESDLALFHFDGSDIDSGTMSEFMIAKFADIPSVILRSDFRAKGDQVDYPWNLMASFYPRTEIVMLDAIRTYKFTGPKKTTTAPHILTDPALALDRASKLTSLISHKVIHAFERLLKTEPLLSGNDQESVFRWMENLFAFKRSKSDVRTIMNRVIERKSRLHPAQTNG